MPVESWMFRFSPSRRDVCAALAEDGRVVWSGRDLVDALGRLDDPAAAGLAVEAGHGSGQRAEHLKGTFLPRQEALGLIGRFTADTRIAKKLARFLTYEADQLEQEVATRPKQGSIRAGEQAPATFNLAEAAAVLSRDPAIRVSGKRLRELLHVWSWIARSTTAAGEARWFPLPLIAAQGYAYTRIVKIPTGELYPELRLTVQGLSKVHELLGGISDLDLSAAPEPLLVEP